MENGCLRFYRTNRNKNQQDPLDKLLSFAEKLLNNSKHFHYRRLGLFSFYKIQFHFVKSHDLICLWCYL